ncbi:hypothetical protein BH23CHL2_BH23CHL2_00380 [soil metagenome]
MTAPYDADAPVINRGTREHHCFGCGTLNQIGLQLEFREMPDGVWAESCPDRRYEGYLGMIHGGVLTAMLDEAMSWAISASGEFTVTTRLNTTFRRPARVQATLLIEGRVVSRGRRLIETAAAIYDVDSGKLVAEAEGRFMRVRADQARAWTDAYFGSDAP